MLTNKWFDSLSMDLLVSITRSCPNVFFILAVEDQRDKDKVSFLKSITDLSWGVHAKLSPLSFMDTKEILAWKFRDKGIAVINSDATTILTERTGGNPLYINLMSDVIRNSELLQGFFFKTSALGKSEKFDIERHLPKSLEACVVLLYGSLDHRFQYLLKAASIYGDCFALEAIANIIEPRCAVLDLMGWIEAFDKFSFLVLQEDDMNSFEKRYSFRHSLIRRVIYESIPVRKRREMHMGILDYFEDVVFGNDVNDKLPVMCYHASRCEDISKHIIHLSRFSELCLSRWMLPECSHALESLINSSNGGRHMILGNWLDGGQN
ncbi:hypothetical protein BC829DRAFT_129559 [Chytridium lagenaria]|nr:hypothetical protein BC829DRAFT_129559 [Chytridium lagenaria]